MFSSGSPFLSIAGLDSHFFERLTCGMISFTVDSAGRAEGILKNIRLITFAESLGGAESLLTYPTVQTHPDVPAEQKERLGISDRLLRLSVGIENPDDILADLEQAFRNAL